jgi:ribulose-5-phosphate 4-epimerase/fuculose-1-phosphate aldolase
MTANLKSVKQASVRDRVSGEEWQARVDLAAAYQLAAQLRWTDLIYTHFSARIPGTEHLLINAYGLMFDEITASNLVKIDLDGNPVGDQPYGANKAGFVIHGAIHRARSDAQCVFHTHTLAGMALSAQEDGLLPVHMYSHNFYAKLAYHEFEGPSMRLDEQQRLVASLGAHGAMILRNHGLLTLGRTIPEAFVRMWRLERSCQIQLAAQGARMRLPSSEVCRQSQALGDEFLTDSAPLGELEFAALERVIERKDPTYRN